MGRAHLAFLVLSCKSTLIFPVKVESPAGFLDQGNLSHEKQVENKIINETTFHANHQHFSWFDFLIYNSSFESVLCSRLYGLNLDQEQKDFSRARPQSLLTCGNPVL